LFQQQTHDGKLRPREESGSAFPRSVRSARLGAQSPLVRSEMDSREPSIGTGRDVRRTGYLDKNVAHGIRIRGMDTRVQHRFHSPAQLRQLLLADGPMSRRSTNRRAHGNAHNWTSSHKSVGKTFDSGSITLTRLLRRPNIGAKLTGLYHARANSRSLSDCREAR
jgi:hypothetical protein